MPATVGSRHKPKPNPSPSPSPNPNQARAVFEVTYTGGPSERCFCDFLCMLVRQSLCLGDLPHGLEALLRERLYPRAALDERPLVRMELASDPELRSVLRSHTSSLQAVYDAACAHGEGGGGGGGEGAAGGVSASAVVALLRDKALLHDARVALTSEIVADASLAGAAASFQCGLSVLQAKSAFQLALPSAAQLAAAIASCTLPPSLRAAAAAQRGGGARLTFAQFERLLCRCAAIKFAKVGAMSRAAQVDCLANPNPNPNPNPEPNPDLDLDPNPDLDSNRSTASCAAPSVSPLSRSSSSRTPSDARRRASRPSRCREASASPWRTSRPSCACGTRCGHSLATLPGHTRCGCTHYGCTHCGCMYYGYTS